MKIGEAAKSLGVTTQTIRNYLKIDPRLLTSEATQEKNKRFSDKDIYILAKIKKLVDKGVKYKDIPAELLKEPIIVEYPDPDEPPLTEPEIMDEPPVDEPEFEYKSTSIAPIEFFENLFNEITTGHKREIDAKNQYIESLESDKAKLESRVEELEHKLYTPWWQKIFRTQND